MITRVIPAKAGTQPGSAGKARLCSRLRGNDAGGGPGYPRFLAVGDAALTVEFGNVVVPELNEQVIAANPGLRGLYVYDVQSWAQAELRVPPIPEPRNYLAIGRYLARYAEQGTDLQLIVTSRRGEPKVYPASDLK